MVEHLVTGMTDFAAGHERLAYFLVGLLALAESLPIVGLIVPGSVLIVGLSTLAATGVLSLQALMLAALLGAMIGDGLSYGLGRRYEATLASTWPLNQYPKLLAQAETLFRRHGGKGVFLARFVQGPRAFVPLVAGMSAMPVGRFYFFNIASAVVWSATHVMTGALIGASLQVAAQVAGRLVLLLVLLAVIVWGVAWLTRRIILTRGIPAIIAGYTYLIRWSESGDQPMQRRARRLLNTLAGEGIVLVGAIALLLASLGLFLGILEDLVTGDPLVQANQAVFNALQALRTTWSDTLMLIVTELGDGLMTTSLTLTITGWLLWRRAWLTAVYWLVAIGGAALFTPVIKALVHWPRPTAGLYEGWEAFSFPSGHATINTVLYGYLGFLVARELPWHKRGWVIGGVTLTVAMIALSRLYLGAHWLADVLAGGAIGTAWLTLLAISHTRHRIAPVGVRGLIGVALLTIACLWPYHIHQQLAVDRQRYVPQPVTRSLSIAAWQRQAYAELPLRRVDLGGESEEPLTLQWAGSVAALTHLLDNQGWKSGVPWSPVNALRWLSPSSPIETLPVLPMLNDGQPPALRASRPLSGSSDQRAILQLWPTHFFVHGAGVSRQPLWVGSITVQHRQSLFGLLAVERRQPDRGLAWNLLQQSLSAMPAEIHQASLKDTRVGQIMLAWYSEE